MYLGGGGPNAPLSIALNPTDFGTAPVCKFEPNCLSVYGLAVAAAWFLYSRCRLSGVAAPGLDPTLLCKCTAPVSRVACAECVGV